MPTSRLIHWLNYLGRKGKKKANAPRKAQPQPRTRTAKGPVTRSRRRGR